MIRCNRCSRANPPGASFCFFDGTSIGSGVAVHADPARHPFPMPFVFPSGKRCGTFDELVLACVADWKGASELLHDGTFAGFLGGMGRADLARAAKQAAADADKDRALDGLIRLMPSTQLQVPRLAVQPQRINFGELKPGQDVVRELRLENAGMGLLSGTVSSAEPWLLLGKPDAPSPRKVFQFLHEAAIPLHVSGKRLRASTKPVEASLVIDTNGGRVEVPVVYSVSVKPYPDGPFAGATTPRQVAEKSLAKPQEAGAYFASGAVKRWYEDNGWDYPVREPASSGVAAVQQYFEALGVSKPPKVRLSRTEIDLSGANGARAEDTVELLTDEKKPIWALVSCDADWLDVREMEIAKKPALVRLGLSRVAGRAGERRSAKVTITTNGRVRHVVTVRLAIQAGGAPYIPPPPPSLPAYIQVAPVTPPLPAPRPFDVLQEVPATPPLPPPPTPMSAVPPPMPPRLPTRRAEEPARKEKAAPVGAAAVWVPVGILALGMLFPIINDIRAFAKEEPGKAGPPSVPFAKEDFSKYPEMLDLGFATRDQDIILSVGGSMKPEGGMLPAGAFPGVHPASMRFGLTLRDGGRKLTFLPDGMTNNAVVQIDGTSHFFGDSGWVAKPPRTERDRVPRGRWLRMDEPVAGEAIRQGRRSTWEFEGNGIQATQTVVLEPGEQSSAFDTCRVSYRIVNTSRTSREVGIRFLLDTFIGRNDGVPFLVPGQTRLVSDKAEFNRGADIPDFVQAFEKEDLADPGTVAQIGLKLHQMETPSRLTLGAYPNPELRKRFLFLAPRFRQMMTEWDVPVVPIKTLETPDSAVVIYWEPKPLGPGKTREVAFTYGLGGVKSGTKGELALTVGGSFFSGGEFTLTAYVKDPPAGETLSLDLPAGLERMNGSAEERVPPLPADRSTRISPVTWKIRAGSEGTHTLKVRTSGGAEQSLEVKIKAKGIFGG